MTQDGIVRFARDIPKMEVYTPPPRGRPVVKPETQRKRRWKRRHKPEALKRWRDRMESRRRIRR